MKLNLSALAVLLLAGFLSGCDSDGDGSGNQLNETQKTQISADSVSFDKTFTPALFYSNLGTQADGATVLVPSMDTLLAARSIMDVLSSSWSAYQTAHGQDLGSADWNGYFSAVSNHVTLARSTYANANARGDNVTPAHNALEDARNILVQMRAQNSITYLMDTVTDTHHKMEPVAGAVTVYNASAKDSAAQAQLISSVTQPLAQFQVAWQVMNSNLTALASTFGMSREKAAYLGVTAGQMSGAINAANSALNAGNAAALATELAKIKPTFVKMFLVFGDFLTPFRTQMVAMEKAYAAVLYCSNNPPDAATTCGGVSGTNTYLLAFENAWNNFRKNYPVLPPSTNTPAALNWKTDMDVIANAINTAKPVVANASSMTGLGDAHNALEEVRLALYHLRHTYENYDFVVDALTAYHTAFEPAVLTVVDPVTKLPKPTLSSEERAAVVAAVPLVRAAFNNMKAKVNAMNATEFGFGTEKTTPLLNAQEINLAALEAAVVSGSGKTDAEIATLMLNVKKTFVPLFKAFGAF